MRSGLPSILLLPNDLKQRQVWMLSNMEYPKAATALTHGNLFNINKQIPAVCCLFMEISSSLPALKIFNS